MKSNGYTLRQMISKEQKTAAIVRLAVQLCERFQGKTLVVIGILTGAYSFLTHLTEAMEEWNSRQPKKRRVTIIVDFLDAASYVPDADGATMKSGGQVKIFKDLRVNIRGRHVLILDDIGDTWRTLKEIVGLLRARKPKSIEVACMIRKLGQAKVRVSVKKHIALTIPNKYVAGSGLDTNGLERAKPAVYEVVPKVA